MKVFLSWAGMTSRLVAEAFYEWLPKVVQRVEPWMSAENIEKGARGSLDLARQLEGTSVGIICVTADNLRAPWLNFEAGALSKVVERSFVCPYLVGLSPSALERPLAEFQYTVAEPTDTLRLVRTVNRALGSEALNDKLLEGAFGAWWPELAKALESALSTEGQPPPEKTERELLEEILAVVRGQTHQLLNPFLRFVNLKPHEAVRLGDVLASGTSRGGGVDFVGIDAEGHSTFLEVKNTTRMADDEELAPRDRKEE